MRASELIAALAELISKHGDLPIRIPIHDDETCLYSYISDIRIENFQREPGYEVSPGGELIKPDIWRINVLTGQKAILID